MQHEGVSESNKGAISISLKRGVVKRRVISCFVARVITRDHRGCIPVPFSEFKIFIPW